MRDHVCQYRAGEAELITLPRTLLTVTLLQCLPHLSLFFLLAGRFSLHAMSSIGEDIIMPLACPPLGNRVIGETGGPLEPVPWLAEDLGPRARGRPLLGERG